MTNNRIFDSVWAFLLAAALSFGGVGCVVTAFSFPDVNLGVLLVVSLVASLLWTVACRFRFGIYVGMTAGVGWLLWQLQALAASWGALLYRISDYLYSGYKWTFLQWKAEVPSGNAEVAFATVACIVSLSVAWTVMGRKKATLAAIAAFLPLAACMMLTNTMPGSEYLMLLLAGLVLLALTNPIRVRNARQANRVTAVLLIPVLLATMGLFQIAPWTDYTPNQSPFLQLEKWLQESPFWQQLTGGGSWTMGDSGTGEVSLAELGSKSVSNRVAFHVTSEKSGYLYLRGRCYDTYDGHSWTVSESSSGWDDGWASAVTEEYTVTVRTPWAQDFYYFPGNSGPRGEIPKLFEKGKLPNPKGETEYSSIWGTPTGGASLTPYVRQQCLQLPEETRIWAREAMKALRGPSAWFVPLSVEQIADLVRESAQYSLTPERMPDSAEDFAEWFFEEAESGYCVHFATTATVLLRAAGIPARYVTGYALEVNSGKESAVRQNRAHAWVEYFDYENGWTIMDPTPDDEEQTQPVNPTEATAPTQVTAPTQTTAPTAATQGETEQTAASGPQADTPTDPDEGEQRGSAAARTVTAVILWMLVCCAGIWGQYRLRISIRSRYMRHGSTNRQALARWRAVSTRSRILRQRPLKRLYQLAEKAKYSQHTITPEELQEFDLYMTGLSATLQDRPWLIRWLLRLVFAIE